MADNGENGAAERKAAEIVPDVIGLLNRGWSGPDLSFHFHGTDRLSRANVPLTTALAIVILHYPRHRRLARNALFELLKSHYRRRAIHHQASKWAYYLKFAWVDHEDFDQDLFLAFNSFVEDWVVSPEFPPSDLRAKLLGWAPLTMSNFSQYRLGSARKQDIPVEHDYFFKTGTEDKDPNAGRLPVSWQKWYELISCDPISVNLRVLLSYLPTIYADVLVAHYVYGYTQKEMARVLNRGEEAVIKLVKRAKDAARWLWDSPGTRNQILECGDEYVCGTCGERFSRCSSAVIHVGQGHVAMEERWQSERFWRLLARVDEGAEKYRCPHCDYASDGYAALVTHERFCKRRRGFPAGPHEEITLPTGARMYPLTNSTLSHAAQRGRLKARKDEKGYWLTTCAYIEEAVESGNIRIFKKKRPEWEAAVRSLHEMWAAEAD
jgi:DNA-directed RNA polymerase specialized sigma24 family protein